MIRATSGGKVADPFRLAVGDPFRSTGGPLSPGSGGRRAPPPSNSSNAPLSPGSPKTGQRRRNSVSYTSLASAAMGEKSSSLSPQVSQRRSDKLVTAPPLLESSRSLSSLPAAPVRKNSCQLHQVLARKNSAGHLGNVPWQVPIGSPMNYVKEKTHTDTRGMCRSGTGLGADMDGIVHIGQQPLSPMSPQSPSSRSQVRLPPMPQAAVIPMTGEGRDGCMKQSWSPSALSPKSNGPTSKTDNERVETASTMDTCDGNPEDKLDSADEDGRTDEDACDLTFVVPEAPTIDDALERFRTGLFLDAEGQRVHKAYRRFVANGDDLDKDCLDLVVNHLGYLMLPEEDTEAMADEVSHLSSFDLEELITFLQAYAAAQKRLLEAAWNKQADKPPEEEGSTIPVEKVLLLLKDLCVIVLNKNFEELLKRAGFEGKENLNFDEVARVVAAYRTCEGFTVDDLKEAKEKFDEAADDDSSKLGIKDLANCLLDFFGVHCVGHLRDLVDAGGEALTYEGHNTPGVSFHEYLIWARQLRNAELLSLFEHFENACEDDDGTLAREELMTVLNHHGFTLSTVEADEFLEEAELQDQESFSFDDTVTFLEACREREGFSEKVHKELTAAYERFDTEQEGEISTIQVLDLLRYLGYQIQVEQVEKYAKEVDFNANGTMDIDEYMRLMRLHREDELRMMQKVFGNRVGRKAGARLKFEDLHDVLNACKCCSSHSDVFDKLCEGAINKAGQPSLNWDEFRDLADKGRKAVMRAQRKKASFTDDEFATLQDTFAEYDLDGTGILGTDALLLLLHRCGVPVHKKSSRSKAVEMLDTARESALDAEMTTEDVGEMGSCTVAFWSMVHAWRMVSRTNEIKNLARVEESVLSANFSATEVEEFRQIFSMWANKKDDDDEEQVEIPAERMERARRRSIADLGSNAPKDMGQSTRDMLTTVKEESGRKGKKGKKKKAISLEILLGIEIPNDQLEFQPFKQLLGHLKMRLGPEHARSLEKQMLILTGNCAGTLDFAQFLEMMKWMLDTNFANINSAAATIAKDVPAVPKQVVKVQLAPDPAEVEPGSPGGLADDANSRSRLVGRRASM